MSISDLRLYQGMNDKELSFSGLIHKVIHKKGEAKPVGRVVLHFIAVVA